MRYRILYSCVSHIGNVRHKNQDNLICDNCYIEPDKAAEGFYLQGTKLIKGNCLFGVFDGLGGEEKGEIASYIAAKNASALEIGTDVVGELSQFCFKVNADICDYAKKNEIYAMGTTAAMLVFSYNGVFLCNVGDSRIFRFSKGILKQISMDHVGVAAFGVKPPLSQNLGIPTEELIIDPYFAKGGYHNKDIYLICSDGLTDYVTTEEITAVLSSSHYETMIERLLSLSLSNGGKDNITIILCKVEREGLNPFKKKGYCKGEEKWKN